MMGDCVSKKVVVLGGTGDAYLISALHAAAQGVHGPIEIVTRERLACVPEMFGIPHSVDDGLVTRAEQDFNFQRDHNNIHSNEIFYAHPCFIRTPFRVDHLTTKPDVSQADMYKMMLLINPYAPLTLPNLPDVEQEEGRVTLIEDSTSWPNTQSSFWPHLVGALQDAGWQVAVNDRGWSLSELFLRCASSEWVIGPQCGVMSVLVTGEFKCRKTLATPSLDGNIRPEYLARETYPYGYVTKFSNRDYDVEEFKIENHNHDELIHSIVHGANGRRLWSHNPWPVHTIQVSLTPGDFLDRLAVLTVKRQRLPDHLRAAQEREFLRYQEQYRQGGFENTEVQKLYHELRELHLHTYEVLDSLVPETLNGGASQDFVAMVRFNKDRVRLKTEIDRVCHAPYTEVKSYYGE